MLSSCSVDIVKFQLDDYLRSIDDLSCQPGFNNSLDGGDCINGYGDVHVPADNLIQLNNIKLIIGNLKESII